MSSAPRFFIALALALAFAAPAPLPAPAPSPNKWERKRQKLETERPDPEDEKQFYNEVFDENGKVRPHYRRIWKIYSMMSAKKRKKFLKGSWRDLRGEYGLSDIPRVLPQAEADQLNLDAEKRAQAIMTFLREYYAGGTRWQQVIPPEVLRRIIDRNGESEFFGKLRPEAIAFPYGPDLIRGPDGKFYVLEDNIGFIGGPGDTQLALESLFKRQPKYAEVMPVQHDPMEYFRELVQAARQRAVPKDGKIVLYAHPPYPDTEDYRIKALFKENNVEVITQNTQRQLIVKKDGVYIRSRDRIGRTPLEKVGYIFLNDEHKWSDALNEITEKQLIVSEAKGLLDEKELDKKSRKKLEKQLARKEKKGDYNYEKIEKIISRSNYVNEIPTYRREAVAGLIDAITAGKVAVNYAPGVDFVGDKEFTPYIEKLYHLYTGEYPTLGAPPTHDFARVGKDGKPSLDESAMETVFSGSNYRKWVVKIKDGRGGDGIYIGPKKSAKEMADVADLVRADPARYQFQMYTPMSRIPSWTGDPDKDLIVDIRKLMTVQSGPNGSIHIVRSKTDWGRGNVAGGDGKANMSATGVEVTQYTMPEDPKKCAMKGLTWFFLKAPKALR